MSNMRLPGFQILPPVIKNLLIVNVLIFIAQETFKNNTMFSINDFFALHDARSEFFKPHQLVTYMFMHGSWSHLFVNMFAVWMFGAQLETVWGGKRFLTFFLVTGIGAGLLHLGVLYLEYAPLVNNISQYDPESQAKIREMVDYGTTVGASGSVFGILAAFGYLFPNNVILIYFLFPMKVKWFVILYAAMELIAGIQNSAGDNVAHWAHLGGAAVGLIMVIYWNKTNRRNFY